MTLATKIALYSTTGNVMYLALPDSDIIKKHVKTVDLLELWLSLRLIMLGIGITAAVVSIVYHLVQHLRYRR